MSAPTPAATPAAQVMLTSRLRLCRFASSDAAFIIELLNDPAFLLNIGDRGVRTLADAHDYITAVLLASYERFGFGLYRVEQRHPPLVLGMCGLLHRDWHPEVELGFAFVPAGRGQGYASEAARASVEHARALRIERLVALTAPDNPGSVRVLEQLGFRFERLIRAPGAVRDSRRFVLELQTAS